VALTQPHPVLLRRAQAGDERAFAQLVEQYEAPLQSYILRMVAGDRALAEDLCQDVMLRVYQNLSGFSLRSSFTTWLFQVAKHRVYDELRARDRRVRPTVDLDACPWLAGSAEPERQVEEMAGVWAAIAALPVDLRMALLLRDVVGLSYLEIADVLDVTLATVKWRIYRAREDVQAALGDALPLRATTAPAAAGTA
jgi:RNA polymerase sigma-70 factor (ECF subfamily)